MRISSVLIALVVAFALPAGASVDVPDQDRCSSAPTIAAEVSPDDPESLRSPVFAGGYVWFGGSVYMPDGTMVRSVPGIGFLRGELIEFNAEIIDPGDAEWGVVAEESGEFAVYSIDGRYLADVPLDEFVEAVYDEGYILATEGISFDAEAPTVLIDANLNIVDIPVIAAQEHDRWGGVVDDAVFVLQGDGSVGRFDTNGRRLGTIKGSNGARIEEVVSAHGYLYALTDQNANEELALMIMAPSGHLVREVVFRSGRLGFGVTERGIAYEFTPRSIEDIPGVGLTEVLGDRQIGLLTPSGDEIALAPGPYADTEDRIFKAHGRYLFVQDFVSRSEPPEEEGPFEPPTATDRIDVILADGTDLGTTPGIVHSEYQVGRPAGDLIAYYAGDGRSVEFRDLAGRLLGSHDFGLGEHASIESMATDHRYLWVHTSELGSGPPAGEEISRAWVLDLGGCAGLPSSGLFVDDDLGVFESDIEWLANSHITQGCDPSKGGTRFCPAEPVTRGQMAAFLHRALGDTLGVTDPVEFGDIGASVFDDDIRWLSATGVTRGCAVDRFCPEDPLTRGQMAALLNRALSLPPAQSPGFDDTDDSVFAGDVARLAGAGITKGCTETSFCPDAPVTRAQMAAFLHRALG